MSSHERDTTLEDLKTFLMGDEEYRLIIETMIANAVREEREACAKIASGFIDEEWPGDDLSSQAEQIADAIRARGEDA